MYKISISQSMTYFKTKNVFSSLNKVFFCILRKLNLLKLVPSHPLLWPPMSSA